MSMWLTQFKESSCPVHTCRPFPQLTEWGQSKLAELGKQCDFLFLHHPENITSSQFFWNVLATVFRLIFPWARNMQINEVQLVAHCLNFSSVENKGINMWGCALGVLNREFNSLGNCRERQHWKPQPVDLEYPQQLEFSLACSCVRSRNKGSWKALTLLQRSRKAFAAQYWPQERKATCAWLSANTPPAWSLTVVLLPVLCLNHSV